MSENEQLTATGMLKFQPPYLHLATSEMRCWSGGMGNFSHCATVLWYTMVRAVITGQSTGFGFDLA